MAKSKKLNKLILIGFKEPQDSELREARITKEFIKESANIDTININHGDETLYFYEGLGKPISSTNSKALTVEGIVTNSFVRDESERVGYKIGNAQCIVSSSVSKGDILRISKLNKIGILVRSGFEDVDFSQMNQSQISEWFETGEYNKNTKNKDDEAESLDGIDFFSSILGGSHDEEPKLEEDMNSQNNSEDNSSHESRGHDTNTGEVNVLDMVNQQMSEAREQDDAHANSTEESQPRNSYISDSPHEDNSYQEDSKHSASGDVNDDVFSQMNSFIEENSSHSQEPEKKKASNPYLDDDGEDEDDNFYVNESSQESPSYSEYSSDVDTHDDEKLDIHSPKSHSSQEPQQDVEDSVFSHSGEDNKPQNAHIDSARKVEEQQKEKRRRRIEAPVPRGKNNAVIDARNKYEEQQDKELFLNSQVEDDSDDFSFGDSGIGDSDTRMLEQNNYDSFETPDFVPDEQSSQDEPMGDSSTELIDEFRENRIKAAKRQKERDSEISKAVKIRKQRLAESRRKSVDEKSSQLNRDVDANMEELRDSSGRVKNYKEYLSAEAANEQSIRESVYERFSGADRDMRTRENAEKAEGQKFVTKNSGRVTLVTAGKGGVGKTLFTCAASSALSLARAKARENNPSLGARRVWLIESDYQSPKLRQVYKTGDRHLGHVAELLAQSKGRATDKNALINAIEDNTHVDEETGVNILACPPVHRTNSSIESVPYAIVSAIKYAIDNGGDVFIDHGQLTSGSYNALDSILAFDISNRVILIADMSCLNETKSTLDLLSGVRANNSHGKRKNRTLINVVLNSSVEKQYLIARDKLKPFNVVGRLPQIPAISRENSLTGDTYFTNAPLEVRKEIIVRVGQMLKDTGYSDLGKYFYENPDLKRTKKRESAKRPWFQRITDKIVK